MDLVLACRRGYHGEQGVSHMSGTTRVTPLDLPRESFVKKTYTAIVCRGGRVLPIEERIGKRLLRVLAPESKEGRSLLDRGIVQLTHADVRRQPGSTAVKPVNRRKHDH